jgi:hypothetical protein
MGKWALCVFRECLREVRTAKLYAAAVPPKHGVIRLTVTAEIMTLEMAEEIHTALAYLSSRGGPYSAIFDLSAVKDTTIPVEVVRGYGRCESSVPTGRKHVVVGAARAIFGLARMFQMCSESIGSEFEVVHTLEEAYEFLGVRPEDFTERLFTGPVAA